MIDDFGPLDTSSLALATLSFLPRQSSDGLQLGIHEGVPEKEFVQIHVAHGLCGGAGLRRAVK